MYVIVKFSLICICLFVAESYAIDQIPATTTSEPPSQPPPTWMTALLVIFGMGFLIFLVLFIGLLAWHFKWCCFSHWKQPQSFSSAPEVPPEIPGCVSAVESSKAQEEGNTKVEATNPKAMQLSINREQNPNLSSEKMTLKKSDPEKMTLKKSDPEKDDKTPQPTKPPPPPKQPSEPKLHEDVLGNKKCPYETLEMGEIVDQKPKKKKEPKQKLHLDAYGKRTSPYKIHKLEP